MSSDYGSVLDLYMAAYACMLVCNFLGLLWPPAFLSASFQDTQGTERRWPEQANFIDAWVANEVAGPVKHVVHLQSCRAWQAFDYNIAAATWTVTADHCAHPPALSCLCRAVLCYAVVCAADAQLGD